jgi:hypothetical protein
LCNFLNSPVTSSLLGPNIPPSTLFSNTLSLCSALNVRDQVPHPYKTTFRIMILYILTSKFVRTTPPNYKLFWIKNMYHVMNVSCKVNIKQPNRWTVEDNFYNVWSEIWALSGWTEPNSVVRYFCKPSLTSVILWSISDMTYAGKKTDVTFASGVLMASVLMFEILYLFPSSTMRVTCPDRVTVFDLRTLIIFCGYKRRSSSLRNFLQSCVTSMFL